MKLPDSAKTRNIEQYTNVHKHDPHYGRSSERFLDVLVATVKSGQRVQRGWEVNTILDFGCGKSRLVNLASNHLAAKAIKYDPAIPEYCNFDIDSADLVLNTDVLEHLDESEIDVLLGDIRKISSNVFFNIATLPAGKQLPNGENAHATVQSQRWWRNRLKRHFEDVVLLPSDPGKATFITWQITSGTHIRLHLQLLLKHNAARRFATRVRSAIQKSIN